MKNALLLNRRCCVINYISEIDECAIDEDDCLDTLADCTNTPPGSFTCTCIAGYTGTGHGHNSCTGNEPPNEIQILNIHIF